eukprot:scaffold105620_cov25-Prasinocladus_malaysianus.AAC.1
MPVALCSAAMPIWRACLIVAVLLSQTPRTHSIVHDVDASNTYEYSNQTRAFPDSANVLQAGG